MSLDAETVFSLHVFNHTINVTNSIVIQWAVMVIITVLVIALTKDFKKIPGKRQSVIEMIVGFISNFVSDNMGDKYKSFIPFIGTMGIFLLFLN